MKEITLIEKIVYDLRFDIGDKVILVETLLSSLYGEGPSIITDNVSYNGRCIYVVELMNKRKPPLSNYIKVFDWEIKLCDK